MEFYSKSKPNLIGKKFKSTVNRIMNKQNTQSGVISDRISNKLSELYNIYIKPNKFVTFLTIAVLVFLCYRYYKKKYGTHEQFSQVEYEALKDVYRQTDHLIHENQPTLNPLQSVESQYNEKVNYPPEPLPINIPKKGIVMTTNLYKDNQVKNDIIMDNYNYNNVYSQPSRSYYTGTYNTYHDAKDTPIINPLGYPTNFNTSTGDFVGQMTGANAQNVADYQNILDKYQNDIVDELKIGPKYLNREYEMDPPYAQNI